MNFQLLPATKDQVNLVYNMIIELTNYEKLTHTVTCTPDILRQAMFPDQGQPKAYAVIAYHGDQVCGMALYYFNFSTFTGLSGLYLEDIYVKPEYRGKALGKLFFKYLAQVAVDQGCTRFEWQVLDWNKSAREFYKRMGAKEGTEWIINTISGQSLHQLAKL